MRQGAVGFGQQLDPVLKLLDVLSHTLVVFGHCPEF
jgi:hypothetical protein